MQVLRTFLRTDDHIWVWRWIWCVCSTNLRGEGVPRKLVRHYFWLCLWRYFQNKLTFEFVEWIKEIVLASVGRHLPNLWGIKRTKRWRKVWVEGAIFSCPQTPQLLVPEPSDSNYSLPWSPCFPSLQTWTGMKPLAFLGLHLANTGS